jgi:hypothetical protein
MALVNPAKPTTSGFNLRGHSLFGTRLLPCSSFDSSRLMKGKCHENSISGSCVSSLCCFYRGLRDGTGPEVGLQRVPICQQA